MSKTKETDPVIIREKQVKRTSGGKFPQGISGNSKGRPVGSRRKSALLVEEIISEKAEEITQKLLKMALEGNIGAMKLVLERISPAPKDLPIKFALPKLENATDALPFMERVIKQVALGKITIEESKGLAHLLETYLKTVEAEEFERRLNALEEAENNQEEG